MQEFELSKEILSEIVDQNVNFADALKKKFQSDVTIRPLRSAVAGLVGCELRHHLLFSYLLEDKADWTVDEKEWVYLALANDYFFKRLDSAALQAELKEKIGEEKLAALQPLFAKAGKPEEYIPVELARSSNKYLSLRYNTPDWVLKIWEHYGYGATYKTLRKDIRPLVSYVRVRTSKTTSDAVLANPDFKKTAVPDILMYEGKLPLRRLDLTHEEKIFVEKPALKATLDKFKVSEPSEALLFTGLKDDAILREFIESYGSSVGLNLGVYNVDQYVGVSQMIKSMGLHNVNFYSAPDPLAMDAAISRPQDLVVVAPDSSNFDLIREYPDYLLHFQRDGMDSLFAKEKAMLEGCSKHVADQGTLLYLIFTISLKEGHQTIAEFLKVHPEFRLVNEQQLFPYEDLDTAMYYAVLHKEMKVEKLGAPIAPIDVIAPEVSVSTSAASEKETPATAAPKEEPAAKEEAKPVEKAEEPAVPVEEAAPKAEEAKIEAPAEEKPAPKKAKKAAAPKVEDKVEPQEEEKPVESAPEVDEKAAAVIAAAPKSSTLLSPR